MITIIYYNYKPTNTVEKKVCLTNKEYEDFVKIIRRDRSNYTILDVREIKTGDDDND